MTAKLQVTEGKCRGLELALQGKAIFEIGSAKTADLSLEDSSVASVHLKVYSANGEFSIFNVSGQGFLHNGKRALKAAVQAGDHVQIGQHVLLLATGSPDHLPDAPPEASPRFELHAVRGDDAGKAFDLGKKETFVIGRGTSADITVWDIRASRVHCQIAHDADGYLLTCLNSSNGTYVNGRRIEKHRLQPGDEIKIGSTVLQYVQH